MSIIGACMVPHPPIILPEIGRGEERKIAETTASYEKAADLVASLKPDTLVIASPHTRMYADWFYIGGGSEGYGSFSQFRAGHVRIHADYDTEMIRALSDAAGREDFPAGPVEDPDIPLDHGVMIPLYFIQKKYTDFKIVRIGISGLALTDHYRLGMMIRDCAEKLGRRVFFVASGDLSHKLRKDGPYGFIEEGPVYDTRIMDVMGSGDFKKLFAFDSARGPLTGPPWISKGSAIRISSESATESAFTGQPVRIPNGISWTSGQRRSPSVWPSARQKKIPMYSWPGFPWRPISAEAGP